MSERIDRSQLRVGNSEREATVVRLNEALEEGRLSLDEFTERMDSVYAAATFGDLDVITMDLPNGAPTPVPAVKSEVTASPSMASFRRTGVWTPPSHIVVNPTMSNVVIDLRRAIITTPVIDVDVKASMSSIAIIVPKDGFCVDDVELNASSVSNRARELPRTTGVKVTVHGSLSMSSISVRRQWRRWWRP